MKSTDAVQIFLESVCSSPPPLPGRFSVHGAALGRLSPCSGRAAGRGAAPAPSAEELEPPWCCQLLAQGVASRRLRELLAGFLLEVVPGNNALKVGEAAPCSVVLGSLLGVLQCPGGWELLATPSQPSPL